VTFLERKWKIKQKWKFIFGLRRKKPKMTNGPFSAPKTKTNFGRLLVWSLDLSDPDPSDFTTDLRHCSYGEIRRATLTRQLRWRRHRPLYDFCIRKDDSRCRLLDKGRSATSMSMLTLSRRTIKKEFVSPVLDLTGGYYMSISHIDSWGVKFPAYPRFRRQCQHCL